MPDTTPEEIARIAEGLTEAQQRALLSVRQDPPRHAPYHIFHNTKENRAAWRAMLKIGFVTEEAPDMILCINAGSQSA